MTNIRNINNISIENEPIEPVILHIEKKNAFDELKDTKEQTRRKKTKSKEKHYYPTIFDFQKNYNRYKFWDKILNKEVKIEFTEDEMEILKRLGMKLGMQGIPPDQHASQFETKGKLEFINEIKRLEYATDQNIDQSKQTYEKLQKLPLSSIIMKYRQARQKYIIMAEKKKLIRELPERPQIKSKQQLKKEKEMEELKRRYGTQVENSPYETLKLYYNMVDLKKISEIRKDIKDKIDADEKKEQEEIEQQKKELEEMKKKEREKKINEENKKNQERLKKKIEIERENQARRNQIGYALRNRPATSTEKRIAEQEGLSLNEEPIKKTKEQIKKHKKKK